MLWPSVRRPGWLRRKAHTLSSAGLNAVEISVMATRRRTAARMRCPMVSTFTSYVMISAPRLREYTASASSCPGVFMRRIEWLKKMTTGDSKSRDLRLPILRGVLPVKAKQIPAEVISGITLAALAIPEVMGYTKISGTPVITGLYTILVPTALFALFGSSRPLVVGADSATAAILAAGLVGLAAPGSDSYLGLAGVLAFMAAGFLFLARLLRLG